MTLFTCLFCLTNICKTKVIANIRCFTVHFVLEISTCMCKHVFMFLSQPNFSPDRIFHLTKSSMCSMITLWLRVVKCRPGYESGVKIVSIFRTPPSKMREPYSNHFVRLSVCPSVRLSTLRCNAITRKVLDLETSYFIHRWRIKKGGHL